MWYYSSRTGKKGTEMINFAQTRNAISLCIKSIPKEMRWKTYYTESIQFIQFKSTIFYAYLDHKTVTSQRFIIFYEASYVFQIASVHVRDYRVNTWLGFGLALLQLKLSLCEGWTSTIFILILSIR